MRGRCIGMDYELYGHIIGIYRRSGKKGGKVGAGKDGKERGERGRGEKCKEAKVK